ncbi:MAG: branched-chain amino acid ABC transporter permease [Candidatus Symbiobacter sp.]|nr:branched-chain amino acid ABC transporter permease [Candidatus Symbiobacter sp.]
MNIMNLMNLMNRINIKHHKILWLHLGVIVILAAVGWFCPDYINLQLTRVMIFALYAMGYNLLFGYTGLLSLGHALFFASGMYGAGLAVAIFGLSALPAFGVGLGVGAAVTGFIAVIALRAQAVGFMIVTMMFAEAVHLGINWQSEFTGGEQGLSLDPALRIINGMGLHLDLTDISTRYFLALALFGVGLWLSLAVIRSKFGRVCRAIRENQARTAMLGYNVTAYKWVIFTLSGIFAAASGAAYGLFYGNIGADFAAVHYSIAPLLWVLVGGAATSLGPFIGTLLMVTMLELLSSLTTASLLAMGVVLILIVLFFPKGILGTIRARYLSWLP